MMTAKATGLSAMVLRIVAVLGLSFNTSISRKQRETNAPFLFLIFQGK
jgi:hypothetical protein